MVPPEPGTVSLHLVFIHFFPPFPLKFQALLGKSFSTTRGPIPGPAINMKGFFTCVFAKLSVHSEDFSKHPVGFAKLVPIGDTVYA